MWRSWQGRTKRRENTTGSSPIRNRTATARGTAAERLAQQGAPAAVQPGRAVTPLQPQACGAAPQTRLDAVRESRKGRSFEARLELQISQPQLRKPGGGGHGADAASAAERGRRVSTPKTGLQSRGRNTLQPLTGPGDRASRRVGGQRRADEPGVWVPPGEAEDRGSQRGARAGVLPHRDTAWLSGV